MGCPLSDLLEGLVLDPDLVSVRQEPPTSHLLTYSVSADVLPGHPVPEPLSGGSSALGSVSPRAVVVPPMEMWCVPRPWSGDDFPSPSCAVPARKGSPTEAVDRCPLALTASPKDTHRQRSCRRRGT